MADISSFDGVSADPLTEDQINAIIVRIDLNIYNLLANKYDLMPHQEHGSAGHSSDPDKLVAELRKTREMYVAMLDQIPVMEITELDDPPNWR